MCAPCCRVAAQTGLTKPALDASALLITMINI